MAVGWRTIHLLPFESIMFPNLFAICPLLRLGHHFAKEPLRSLVMAIVGGAVALFDGVDWKTTWQLALLYHLFASLLVAFML